MRKRVHWSLKFTAKVVLAYIPYRYQIFSHLNLFRHGRMDSADYALRVFRKHLQRSSLNSLENLICLELGPGDSVSSGIIAHAMGAAHSYLVDSGAFASQSLEGYRALIEELQKDGFYPDGPPRFETFEELLKQFRITYLSQGVRSLATIPTATIDFCFSQAVLEHVQLEEVAETLAHFRRVCSPYGISSHRIDLKDHLASSLNHLRFSPRLWETNWIRRSGIYTNRLRHQQWLEGFKTAGFSNVEVECDRWSELPLDRSKLHPSFHNWPDAELLVYGVNVLANSLSDKR
jgi:hypothetical protein